MKAWFRMMPFNSSCQDQKMRRLKRKLIRWSRRHTRWMKPKYHMQDTKMLNKSLIQEHLRAFWDKNNRINRRRQQQEDGMRVTLRRRRTKARRSWMKERQVEHLNHQTVIVTAMRATGQQSRIRWRASTLTLHMQPKWSQYQVLLALEELQLQLPKKRASSSQERLPESTHPNKKLSTPSHHQASLRRNLLLRMLYEVAWNSPNKAFPASWKRSSHQQLQLSPRRQSKQSHQHVLHANQWSMRPSGSTQLILSITRSQTLSTTTCII